jgi:hypothetical protein
MNAVLQHDPPLDLFESRLCQVNCLVASGNEFADFDRFRLIDHWNPKNAVLRHLLKLRTLLANTL